MTKFRGGYPALGWLAKRDPVAAMAVLDAIRNSSHQVRHVDAPGYLDPRDHSADDAETCVAPDDALTSETLAEPTQDGPDEIHAESLHEIKPDLHGMLRCAGGLAFSWCGERWRNKQTGKVRYVGEPWAYMWCCLPHVPERHVLTIGGLTFYTRPGAMRGRAGGMLRSYVDANGKEQRPSYATSKPRGGKRPHRTNAAIIDYLAKPAAIASPLRVDGYQRPMSGEPALMPMLTLLQRRAPDKSMNICGQIDREGRYGVAEARAVLVAFGVDGSVPFEMLPFPAKRCPTAIARGSRFVAGITGAKQTASVPAPSWQIPEAKPLSPILQEVASRGNLESIGAALGYRGGSRDRAGRKALLAAGRALVASNDNRPQRAAQAA